MVRQFRMAYRSTSSTASSCERRAGFINVSHYRVKGNPPTAVMSPEMEIVRQTTNSVGHRALVRVPFSWIAKRSSVHAVHSSLYTPPIHLSGNFVRSLLGAASERSASYSKIVLRLRQRMVHSTLRCSAVFLHATARRAMSTQGTAPLGAQLFQRQADLYAQYRPTYPEELFDAIERYARSDASRRKHQLAVDVATGSGQAARALAARYDRVIAIDAAKEQLDHAEKHDRVEYALGNAEAVDTILHDVADEKADLIVVAQALHWFDLTSFYSAAHRSLRKGGVLAIVGYSTNTLRALDSNDDESEATRVFNALYDGTLGPYWNHGRRLLETYYDGMDPDTSLFADRQRADFTMARDMPVDGVVGYVSSWSAYHTYLRQNAGAESAEQRDPLPEFHRALSRAVPSGKIRVEWPLFLYLYRAV